MGRRVFLDRFTSLDDLPRSVWSNDRVVLQRLSEVGIFSVFEVAEYAALGNTVTDLEKRGLIATDHKSIGYPWILAKLTDAGRALLAQK